MFTGYGFKANPLNFTQTQIIVTNASQTLIPANPNRKFLVIYNFDSSGVIWLNTTGAATTSPPSIRIAVGSQFLLTIHYITTAAIQLIGSLASNANVTVLEGA